VDRRAPTLPLVVEWSESEFRRHSAVLVAAGRVAAPRGISADTPSARRLAIDDDASLIVSDASETSVFAARGSVRG
jgi:hypothetical protein